jgi:hypothetical protein
MTSDPNRVTCNKLPWPEGMLILEPGELLVISMPIMDHAEFDAWHAALEDTQFKGRIMLVEGAEQFAVLKPPASASPHPTCIDVTPAHRPPHTEWICGVDCPRPEQATPTTQGDPRR